jgi:hypothetical protein
MNVARLPPVSVSDVADTANALIGPQPFYFPATDPGIASFDEVRIELRTARH